MLTWFMGYNNDLRILMAVKICLTRNEALDKDKVVLVNYLVETSS